MQGIQSSCVKHQKPFEYFAEATSDFLAAQLYCVDCNEGEKNRAVVSLVQLRQQYLEAFSKYDQSFKNPIKSTIESFFGASLSQMENILTKQYLTMNIKKENIDENLTNLEYLQNLTGLVTSMYQVAENNKKENQKIILNLGQVSYCLKKSEYWLKESVKYLKSKEGKSNQQEISQSAQQKLPNKLENARVNEMIRLIYQNEEENKKQLTRRDENISKLQTSLNDRIQSYLTINRKFQSLQYESEMKNNRNAEYLQRKVEDAKQLIRQKDSTILVLKDDIKRLGASQMRSQSVVKGQNVQREQLEHQREVIKNKSEKIEELQLQISKINASNVDLIKIKDQAIIHLQQTVHSQSEQINKLLLRVQEMQLKSKSEKIEVRQNQYEKRQIRSEHHNSLDLYQTHQSLDVSEERLKEQEQRLTLKKTEYRDEKITAISNVQQEAKQEENDQSTNNLENRREKESKASQLIVIDKSNKTKRFQPLQETKKSSNFIKKQQAPLEEYPSNVPNDNSDTFSVIEVEKSNQKEDESKVLIDQIDSLVYPTGSNSIAYELNSSNQAGLVKSSDIPVRLNKTQEHFYNSILKSSKIINSQAIQSYILNWLLTAQIYFNSAYLLKYSSVSERSYLSIDTVRSQLNRKNIFILVLTKDNQMLGLFLRQSIFEKSTTKPLLFLYSKAMKLEMDLKKMDYYSDQLIISLSSQDKNQKDVLYQFRFFKKSSYYAQLEIRKVSLNGSKIDSMQGEAYEIFQFT